jgi:deoxyribonuclease V
MWPLDAESLMALQLELAAADPEPWQPPVGDLRVGGCWVCFPRGLSGRGAAGDEAWVASVVMRGVEIVAQGVRRGVAGAPYSPGLLALRLGMLMDEAVRALATPADVLLVDATARDHPRGAGLALHLGAELDLPTVGITHRPLLASSAAPADRRGATSSLVLDGVVVGCWMRTRPGVRPVVVHPGWRVDLATAVEVVLGATGSRRTPEPLRRARRLARIARQFDGEPGVGGRL